ncbi:MAG: tetratricopeptide repeat protein [Chthoniobacterales bacterium]
MRRKLDQAIKMDPTFWPAFYTRADLSDTQEKWAEVVADTTRALQWDPKFAAALILRSRANSLLGRYRAAVVDLERTVSLRPDEDLYSYALNELAWILATIPVKPLRNPSRAVELAKRACEITHWKDGEIIDTLAAAHAAKGDFNSAVRFEKSRVRLNARALKAGADISPPLSGTKPPSSRTHISSL